MQTDNSNNWRQGEQPVPWWERAATCGDRLLLKQVALDHASGYQFADAETLHRWLAKGPVSTRETEVPPPYPLPPLRFDSWDDGLEWLYGEPDPTALTNGD